MDPKLQVTAVVNGGERKNVGYADPGEEKGAYVLTIATEFKDAELTEVNVETDEGDTALPEKSKK